jgi:hypothetical protein
MPVGTVNIEGTSAEGLSAAARGGVKGFVAAVLLACVNE